MRPRRVVFVFVAKRRRVRFRFWRLLKKKTESLLLRLQNCVRLFWVRIVYAERSNTNINVLDENFSNPFACLFFFHTVAHSPSCISFRMSRRCSAVVLVLLLFRSEQNKLIWIVSCNPAIRLFRFAHAIGIVRSQYSGDYIVATIRMVAGRWCRCEFRKDRKLCSEASSVDAKRKKGTGGDRRTFFAVLLLRVVRVSSWTCPTRKAIKSHLLTEWIRRILRLIEHKVENYFPMRVLCTRNSAYAKQSIRTHSIWQKWNNVQALTTPNRILIMP